MSKRESTTYASRAFGSEKKRQSLTERKLESMGSLKREGVAAVKRVTCPDCKARPVPSGRYLCQECEERLTEEIMERENVSPLVYTHRSRGILLWACSAAITVLMVADMTLMNQAPDGDSPLMAAIRDQTYQVSHVVGGLLHSIKDAVK